MNRPQAMDAWGDGGIKRSRRQEPRASGGILVRFMTLAAMTTVLVSCAAYHPVSLPNVTDGTIEIVIRDLAYQVQSGFLKVGEPTTIHVTNADSVTHGFEWALVDGAQIEEGKVRIETNGITAYTLGSSTLHLDPGAEVRVQFTPTQPGRIIFRCDIHASMKGEVWVLRIGQPQDGEKR